MKKLLNQILVLICLAILATPQAVGNEWRDLLGNDLSGWEPWLGPPEDSVIVPGRSDTNSKEPIGLSDPLNVYTIRHEDGEPILNITGEVFGGISTIKEFKDYHLSLEFRWRDKKWPPRLNAKRDSGLLLHCVGEHGAAWGNWMQSLECQIQETDCGDYIPLAGAKATTTVSASERGDGGNPVFLQGGQPLHDAEYVDHGPSKEKPHGEWNLIEVYALGDRLVFCVNGTPNMALSNATMKTVDGNRVPLTGGRLQIQSEAAEVEYRRIKIRSIKEFPTEMQALFE